MAIQDDLPQLILCPLLEDYDVEIGDDVTSTQFTNGPPRQRLNGVGRPHQVRVRFRHKAVHQDYLLSFWRLQRTKPFAMRLIIDSTSMEWYECRFIGSPKPQVLGGGIFEMSAMLVVTARPLNLEVDAAFVYLYNETKGDISTFFNALEKLVNEDLPDALGSLNA